MSKVDGYLPPWLLQLLGIAILLGAVVFWIVADQQSALIVAAAMTLIGLGAYSGIRISIRQAVNEERHEIHQRSADLAVESVEE